MNLAERYEKLFGNSLSRLHEIAAERDGAALTELELQAHWFAGDFGTEFTSVRGEKIIVAQFGVWNREAGPDFAEAAVSINGGPAVRGSIEIDPDAPDWERHGHATNPDYNEVVLHVCARQEGREFFTRTARHKEVPRVRLDLERLAGKPSNPVPAAKLGRCSAPLRGMEPLKLREILEGAAQFRLRKKSARLARIGALHGADEALYQGLAVALGYKNNKLPFTLLAQRLPLKFLRKHATDVDAILFGTAGFLDKADFTKFDLETRSYLRELWDQWWKLRDGFARLALPRDAWRLASVRPANHPQRRLAALAQIVKHSRQIRALVDKGEIGAVRDFLAGLRDEYWDFHYTLTSKKAAKRMALIGGTRINDMLANVIYPLVIAAHPERWKDYLKLPAQQVSQRVEIAMLRLLGGSAQAKTLAKSAVMQQGLLQIYEDFCMRDNTDCERCPFPEQAGKW